MEALVHVVLVPVLLVVVPAGLALITGAGVARARRAWPWLAVPALVALWLPRGAVAAALCLPYALLTVALAVGAVHRALHRTQHRATEDVPGPSHGWPVEIAVWTALAAPAVGGVALVGERAGTRLFGFRLEVLALTVAHFHVAGFTAALVAGLVARATRPGALSVVAALCVPVGTATVLVGFFAGDDVQLLGALVLTAGMWATGWSTWRQLRPASRDRTTRSLLAASSAVLAVTMALALSWAVGEATGLPHPSIGWMAATHGVANALGFAPASVLAWRRLRPALL